VRPTWRVVVGATLLTTTLAANAIGEQSTTAAQSTPSQLAAALQHKYDGVKDFSADFVHAYEGGVLHKQITERGKLLIKKPGKMRWEYTSPERKLFVSDGVQMYSYIPQDKQVIVSPVPAADEAATPTLFLAGKGNLTRDFSPSLVELPPGMPAGTIALKLVPKTKQREYDWLTLVVDPRSLVISGLVTVDAQGGTSRFSFSNLKENIGVADKEFAFSAPRGVDIVKASARD
jgi:outer membrane lipoprotein carrier protein